LRRQLDTAAALTVQFLGTRSARVEIAAAAVSDANVEIVVAVQNLSGYKLPAAYPSRRAWLYVTVSDAAGNLLFESGKLSPDGTGNACCGPAS
jgi:hypothetical protein